MMMDQVLRKSMKKLKENSNLENGEGVIISSSLSNKIEENKELERLVEERLAHNPLLNEILKDSNSKTPKDEEEKIEK